MTPYDPLTNRQQARIGAANVNVVVTDVNDNKPAFTLKTYKKKIPEDFPSGENVIRVLAVDEDQGKNAQISYVFSQTGSGYFSIDEETGACVCACVCVWAFTRFHTLLNQPGNFKL